MAGLREPRRGCRSPTPRARRAAVRFEDTDRFVRGRIVAALLAGEPLPAARAAAAARALAGLERDGLVVRAGSGWQLPGAPVPA